ncbi:uncharacterized protein LOC114868346 [Betta splendens]|uniref:Uncharacterized protein LOC114868346 n=1 Tax=Betta splendens TaxID=158456 RepID=A0A6P7P5D0_BETSP|nr:uncharacterized protein LOC114868346 [Betta splendens]
MCFVLLRVLALTCYCTGTSSASASSDAALAFLGGAVILPCSHREASGGDIHTVEWSKQGLQPDVVFLYRDGCETFEMKHPDFEYRTSLVLKELKTGNVSLRISHVKLSDAGTYKCLKIWRNSTREVTNVQLVVVAVSEPKLSVVSADGAAVTLQCESGCSLPEPTMEFVDDQGTRLAAEAAHRGPEASGCSTVTRRMRLQSATTRVTCRVHQPQIGQSRDTEILIAGHRSFRPVVGILAVLVLVFGVGGTVLFLQRRLCGSGPNMMRTSGDQSIHITSNGAGNTFTCSCETLKAQVAELKRQLVQSNDTIDQLEKSLESNRSPVVCQHRQPTFVCTASADVPKATNMDASTSTDLQNRAPDLQHNGPDLQRNGPDLQHNGPNLQRNGPDLQHNGPDLQHNGPDLQRNGPDLQHNGPNLQRNGPDLQRMGPDLQRMGPDLQHNGPDLQRMGPDLQHMGPDLQRMGPDLQRNGPDLKRMGPDLQNRAPDLQGKGSNQQGNGPGIQRENSEPALRCLVQGNRRHSTFHPTASNTAPSTVISRRRLSRSISEYSTLPDPVSFKPPRRNSSGNTFPPVSPTRYSHVSHLKEESDPLITWDSK